MSDFSVITPRLVTGAAITDPEDVAALITAGVTHVIDCRDDFDDSELLADHGLLYLWNGTPDDGTTKPPAWFDRSLSFALPAIAQPRTKIYAHCAAGVNRGPSTAYAILRALGWLPTVADALIRSKRPQVGLAYAGDADNAIFALGYAG
jgi:protein-tyrosine phosphatase